MDDSSPTWWIKWEREEEQVSVKQQAVFPGCVQPGLRAAVGGEVGELGHADPVGPCEPSYGVWTWSSRQWEAIGGMQGTQANL